MGALLNNHEFFIHLAGYGSLALILGLLFSYVLRRHAARAFQVLWLAMLASLLLPFGAMLVKHFEWGFLEEATPTPVVVTPLEDIAIESDLVVEEEILDFANDLETYEGPTLVNHVSLEQPHQPFPWRGTLLIGWGGLSLALMLRLTIRWQRMRLLLNQCTDQHQHLTRQLEQNLPTSLQINRTLHVLSHTQIRTPAIWCWGRDLTLLVPEHVQPDTDWVSVFCHELAHAQRRDHLSGLFAEILVCLLPWQPLMWWTKHRLALLSEQACDDWVLASGREGTDYAESLLNLLPQRQVAFIPTVASNRKGVAGRIERILKDQCSNPHPGWTWSLCITLVTMLLTVTLALAQTRPDTGTDPYFSAPTLEKQNNLDQHPDSTETITQKPGESDAAFRARRARELAKQRAAHAAEQNRDNRPLATDPQAPQLKATTESLRQHADESQAAYQQRLFESAVKAAQICIPYQSHESTYEYHIRRQRELVKLRSQLPLTPPAHADLAIFHERLVEQIQSLIPTRSEYTSDESEIRQHPGESDAAFRARRARALAKSRAAGNRTERPLAMDPQAPRLKASAESLVQRFEESQATYQQRLFESAVKAAQVYIPYQSDETTSEYHTRRQWELVKLRSQLKLTPTSNENLILFYERLVEQIQALIPTQSAKIYGEMEITQNPGESDAAFRARRARALAKARAANSRKRIESPLAQDPQAPKLKANTQSLLQYTDETQADYQQRLFESAVRAAQVYIPYQPQESTSEYHARRKKILSELRDKLALTPPANEDPALFHERLVEQIQALLPTPTSNATEEIKQNPGESDAAFRARRARELAKQKATQRNEN